MRRISKPEARPLCAPSTPSLMRADQLRRPAPAWARRRRRPRPPPLHPPNGAQAAGEGAGQKSEIRGPKWSPFGRNGADSITRLRRCPTKDTTILSRPNCQPDRARRRPFHYVGRRGRGRCRACPPIVVRRFGRLWGPPKPNSGAAPRPEGARRGPGGSGRRPLGVIDSGRQIFKVAAANERPWACCPRFRFQWRPRVGPPSRLAAPGASRTRSVGSGSTLAQGALGLLWNRLIGPVQMPSVQFARLQWVPSGPARQAAGSAI